MTRRIKRTQQTQSGQAMIEMSMAMMFLLAFMYVMTDVLKVTYTYTALQYVASESSRYGSTGSQEIDPNSGQPLNRSQSVKEVAKQLAQDLMVDLKDDGISFRDVDGTTVDNSGQALDFRVLTVTSEVDLSPLASLINSVFGNNVGHNKLNVNAEAIVRNEPFN
jgi:Flp pilus assembly protein TadG